MQGAALPTRNNSHYLWGLNQCAEEISTFLSSLNATDFRDGLVYFDALKGRLWTYSRWSSNPTYQKLVNLRNPQATFSQTQSGFEFLNSRVSFLWGQLLSFNPEHLQDCSEKCEKLAIYLCRDIPKIVEEIAKTGLAKLEGNYNRLGEKDHGTVVSDLGKQAFKRLSRCKELLITQWVVHLPDPKSLCPLVEGLSSLVERRAMLEEQHENCRNGLRQVTWNPNSGTTIPEPVLQACLQGLFPREGVDPPKKGFLRLTANYLRIPSKAKSIPAQGGETHWHPLRPVKNDKGTYEMAKGVVGTCERDSLSSDNLCNLYCRIDPLTFHLVMTCGIIGSDAHVEQLGAAIAYIQSKKPDSFKTGRWMFHSVGSSKEIQRLSSKFCNQKLLDQQLKRNDLSVLHFHTCFESRLSETSRSLHKANLENLAFLMEYVLIDAAQLLNGTAAVLPKDGQGFLTKQCAVLVSLAKEVQQLTNQSNPDKAIDRNLEALQKQGELHDELKKMADYLRIAIELLGRMPKEKNTLPTDQTILLFKVMHQLLLSQLETNDIRNALPLGQLEWLLFLYRLLDIKVVLTSDSGLDEGSVAAAMADAQSQLERAFYQESIKKKMTSPNAWLMARNKMFDLMLKLPEARDILVRRFSCREYKGISTPKLDHLNAAPDEIVRELLMREIELPVPEKEMLTWALHYMEHVTTHLLSAEAEKTLNSTGRAGLLIKNIDALNRMAPFAVRGEATIHLSDLSAGKAFDSTALTDMGKAILMHSSSSRKP